MAAKRVRLYQCNSALICAYSEEQALEFYATHYQASPCDYAPETSTYDALISLQEAIDLITKLDSKGTYGKHEFVFHPNYGLCNKRSALSKMSEKIIQGTMPPFELVYYGNPVVQ